VIARSPPPPGRPFPGPTLHPGTAVRAAVGPYRSGMPARCAPPLLAAALVALALLAPGASLAAGRAGCAPTLAGELSATGAARQLVTVVASGPGSTTGSLSLWQRAGGCWLERAGPWSVWLGRNGVSAHHREGDDTTPAGAFGIGPVIYGAAPDPGVAYRYQRLDCGDWWDEDPSSPAYNTFVQLRCGERPSFGGASEPLWLSPSAYAYFALIDYNTRPVVPGAGSAIFIHVSFGAPTDGCVALPRGELVELLRWLAPSRSPLIVIGTAARIRGY
jgi:L,D-peptidoglycan transpeptidase YkuD (ErfK/YbiS/YcfS/YnhG family)